jgi:biotin carboxyl carrier protein
MNVERVETLLRLLQEASAGEMVVEGEGWRVGARKACVAQPPPIAEATPAPVERAEPVEAPPRHCAVTANLVGIFHESEPPVIEGDSVGAGQPLGSIESMGILNPVLSPVSGDVTRVIVRDEQGVQYGQELLVLLEPPETGAV